MPVRDRPRADALVADLFALHPPLTVAPEDRGLAAGTLRKTATGPARRRAS